MQTSQTRPALFRKCFALAIQTETLAPSSYKKSVVVPMPSPSEAVNKPKVNAYAQKVVVKQAPRGHAADQLQDSQKQRLLQPESPRTSDSPRSSTPLQPQQLPPLSNHPPQQPPQHFQLQPEQQLQQQQQPQLPQQVALDQWQWLESQTASPGQHAFEVTAQQPTLSQQNGMQARSRPASASFANSLVQDSPSQTQSQASSRTVTASPRVTNDLPFGTMQTKNVSWKDAQGEDLCHYRDFEPSDASDSDSDETDWQTQKKGCCILM